MSTQKKLERLRWLATQFLHERPQEAQIAAEISLLVAGLNGTMFDDGKAIAFATAVLLFATCPGMREHAYNSIEREIADAVRSAS
jgi:hypothetical protein